MAKTHVERLFDFALKLKSLTSITMMSALMISTLIGCVPKDMAITKSTKASEQETFTGILSATTLSGTKVKLTWNAALDQPTVIAYKIYDMSNLFSPRLVATAVGRERNSITLTDLTPQKYYLFRIRTAEKDGKEDINTLDIPAIPYDGVTAVNVLSSSSAELTYANASNADAVEVYCKEGLNPLERLMSPAPAADINRTKINLTNLTPALSYSCRVALNIGGFTDNNQTYVSFVPIGTADHLVFETQPSSATAGSIFNTQPVVRVVDANGTTVSAGPDATATITLTIPVDSPTAGSIRGTASMSAVAGYARFTGLSLEEAGSKLMLATKSETLSISVERGSGVKTVTSDPFVISPDIVSPIKSSIAVAPAGPLVADGNTSYAVSITLQDKFGNPIANVKPAFASSIGGDSIIQPTANTDVTGTSSGTISTTVADSTRVVSISSPSGLSSVTANAPFIAGAPTKLLFLTQPGNAGAGGAMGTISVGVYDTFNNLVKSGVGSNSAVNLALASNTDGSTLSGTPSQIAVGGIATFTDLSIDKTGNNKQLQANSAAYTTAFSNYFNITAASPYKIGIIAPDRTVVSGACSAAIKFQLQDSGNNPSSAIQSTPITIGGLGNAQLFTSASCTGTAQATTQSFSPGSKERTFYLKDVKGEALTITANDPSSVLIGSSIEFKVTPSKLNLSLSSISVPAGKCSQAMTITPMGFNSGAAPLFSATNAKMVGLDSSPALVYTDAACTQAVSATSIPLNINTTTDHTTKVYLKGDKAEPLNLNVADAASVLGVEGSLSPFNITASDISFIGPASVISGACSSAFTISLRDKLNTPVTATADLPLSIRGLESSTTGAFYLSPSCTGTTFKTSLTIPSGNSTIQVWFKDSKAEVLNVFLRDPAGNLADSPTIGIGISPSAFGITSAVTTAKTSVCAGPYTLTTLDGSGQVTAAIDAVTANLSGASASGDFFANAGCTIKVSNYVFAPGESTKTFYVQVDYPGALTLRATDPAAKLAEASRALTITAAIAYIGTTSSITDSNGDLLWFTKNISPVAARQNAPRAPQAVHFDATKSYMYVSDQTQHRIFKYDYVNKKFLGWIGVYQNGDSNYTIPNNSITGSALPSPTNAQCIGTANRTPTPGWCLGGQSTYSDNNANGALRDPRMVADDGNYLYVVNEYGFNVSRFKAETGEFAGWIGTVSSTPSGAAPGGPASCATTSTLGAPTPGWCMGGQNYNNNNSGSNPLLGNGQIYRPYAIVYFGGYLFVSTRGAILSFNATTGAFAGWIGEVATQPTGGAAGCQSTMPGSVTPGWCTGGSFTMGTDRSSTGSVHAPVGMTVLTHNGTSTLYVLYQTGGGSIAAYNPTTGAFLGRRNPTGTSQLTNPLSITNDGTDLFIADANRLVRFDFATNDVTGWIGKVGTTPTNQGSGNPLSCTTLSANDLTPGWCLGGNARYGMEEAAFQRTQGLGFDGVNLIAVGGEQAYPSIKSFTAATGVFNGSLVRRSVSQSKWSASQSSVAEYDGFDDFSMNSPAGSYLNGDFMYLAEWGAGRIKKINIKTGQTIGWIGAIASSPTGGEQPGCAGASPFGASPGWCLGSLPNPNFMYYQGNQWINSQANGNMYQPMGLTGDGTHLYVTDHGLHRVQKFRMSDGQFVGWIGRIGTSPSGGATGCQGAPVNTFTPGWCTGGLSNAGSDDGNLRNPTGIVYVAATNNIYVVDYSNHRVVAYNATTGAFVGWIGRISSNPTGGCTFGNNGNGYAVSQNGWCTGGTAQASVSGDRGGGFNFNVSRSGITTDGTNLYIGNTQNFRIDRWSTAGVFLGATSSRFTEYTSTWTTTGTTLAGWSNVGQSYVKGIWADTNFLYVVMQANYYTSSTVVSKINLSTGTTVGWKGLILAAFPPSNGDPGCSGGSGVTPGWCQGGAPNFGYTLGGFSSANYITGDANYLYISDEDTHRVTRITK